MRACADRAADLGHALGFARFFLTTHLLNRRLPENRQDTKNAKVRHREFGVQRENHHKILARSGGLGVLAVDFYSTRGLIVHLARLRALLRRRTGLAG